MLKLSQAQLEYLSTLEELPEAEHPEDKCALIWIGGSHAYGIADEHSDVDVRAATMPTMRQILSPPRLRGEAHAGLRHGRPLLSQSGANAP